MLPFVVSAIVSVEREPDRLRRYIGGLHREAFLLAVWESITCVGLCGFLWVSFRQHFNRSTRLSRFSPDTYCVYFIHPLIVVGATMLFEHVSLPPSAKFLTVTTLSIAACFLIAHNLRKLPGVGRIL